jgi:hypothetical protein
MSISVDKEALRRSNPAQGIVVELVEEVGRGPFLLTAASDEGQDRQW